MPMHFYNIVRSYRNELKNLIKGHETEFDRRSRANQEILLEEDKQVLREASVIGMTTTGAARYQRVLEEIGPRIGKLYRLFIMLMLPADQEYQTTTFNCWVSFK